MAVNGVTFVGHHVNKDSGNKGKMTMAFDNCGGHGGADHKYHYHIPPVCLIMSLGGEVPERSDWWLAKNPESQWPKMTQKESPVIGWAMDGFPIFGPYDPITKELQTSGAAGCDGATLDECNGKTLSNGQYAYFVTPTYPHVPSCLKGSALGTVAEGPAVDTYSNKCPMMGYSPMSTETGRDCTTLPQSLYLPVKEEPKWTAVTVVVGVGHLVLAAASLALGNPLKIASALNTRTASAIVAGFAFGNPDDRSAVRGSLVRLFWAVFLSALTRAIFLLIDPYHMRGLFPNLLSELLYGALYPLVNLAGLEGLFLTSPEPLRTRPTAYLAGLVVVFCQFIFQFTFDGLRAYGQQPAWHWVCQVFYSAWGIIVLGAAIYYALKAGKALWAAAAALSFILVIDSVVLLSVSIGSSTSNTYFSMLTWLRFLEAGVVAGYVVVLRQAVKEAALTQDGDHIQAAVVADAKHRSLEAPSPATHATPTHHMGIAPALPPMLPTHLQHLGPGVAQGHPGLFYPGGGLPAVSVSNPSSFEQNY
uniref:YHYH domain-containing protein n=2 Tax=Hemiselmis andersenii TaxID=464988 RepID=A0A7S1EAZ7_HEMAN